MKVARVLIDKEVLKENIRAMYRDSDDQFEEMYEQYDEAITDVLESIDSLPTTDLAEAEEPRSKKRSRHFQDHCEDDTSPLETKNHNWK